MDQLQAAVAVNEMADLICASMDGVRIHNPTLSDVYAVCLAISDDFSYAALYANTESFLAQKPTRGRWDVYGWWSEGMDLSVAPLRSHIGRVNDSDSQPEHDNGPAWLAVLTRAMGVSDAAGAFAFTNSQPYLFCTMTDSANSDWIEYLTGRELNDGARFDAIAGEIAEAHRAPAAGPLTAGRSPYRDAFVRVLNELNAGPW
ncbi:MAG TPA: hypothetical protein VHB77_01045 [Planctomycetaceae bacterium]|nr:hypothetical protein [Planctomycetaceae bacterium]